MIKREKKNGAEQIERRSRRKWKDEKGEQSKRKATSDKHHTDAS